MKDLHNKKDYQDTSFPLHIFLQRLCFNVKTFHLVMSLIDKRKHGKKIL